MKDENITSAIKYADELDKKWAYYTENVECKTLAELSVTLTGRVLKADGSKSRDLARDNLKKFILAVDLIEEALKGE